MYLFLPTEACQIFLLIGLWTGDLSEALWGVLFFAIYIVFSGNPSACEDFMLCPWTDLAERIAELSYWWIMGYYWLLSRLESHGKQTVIYNVLRLQRAIILLLDVLCKSSI